MKYMLECEYNKEYYFDLDGDKKDDKILLSYTEFDVKLSINDKFFILEGFESLNKTQDNTIGYVHETDGKIDGSDSFPPQIIEYLLICD